MKKVKVVSCSDKLLWYNAYIGQTFDVYFEDSGSYWVNEPSEHYAIKNWIFKHHAVEVLEKGKEDKMEIVNTEHIFKVDSSKVPEVKVQSKQSFTAPDILRKAEEIMRERGKQYDQDQGERSMEKIVNAFNAATGYNLKESDGWMFMMFLKIIRDNSKKEGHQDSCEDLVAYSALYGESRLKKGNQ